MINKSKVISLRLEGLTFADIGKQFNTSRQRIHQIIKKAAKDYPKLLFCSRKEALPQYSQSPATLGAKIHKECHDNLKRCCICKLYLPLDNFHKNKGSRDGLSKYCKSCNTNKQNIYYRKHPDIVISNNLKYRQKNPDKVRAWVNKSYLLMRTKVLTHYGNDKCACVKCGFDDIRALSIDHINGYGKKPTKTYSNRSGTGLYYWLVRLNYPEGFQTLCMNCQFVKRAINKERAGHDSKYNNL